MSTFNYVYQGKSYSENDLIQAAFQWAKKQKKDGVEGWKDFDFEQTIRVGDSNYKKIKQDYLQAYEGKIKKEVTKNKKILDEQTETLYDSDAVKMIDFKEVNVKNNQLNNQTPFWQAKTKSIDLGYGKKTETYLYKGKDPGGGWTDRVGYRTVKYHKGYRKEHYIAKYDPNGDHLENVYEDSSLTFEELDKLAKEMTQASHDTYLKDHALRLTKDMFTYADETDEHKGGFTIVPGETTKKFFKTIEQVTGLDVEQLTGSTYYDARDKSFTLADIIEQLEEAGHMDTADQLSAVLADLIVNPSEDHTTLGANHTVSSTKDGFLIIDDVVTSVHEDDLDGFVYLSQAPVGQKKTNIKRGTLLEVIDSDIDSKGEFNGVKDLTFEDGVATTAEITSRYGIKKEHIQYYDFVHDGEKFGFIPQLKENAEELAKDNGHKWEDITKDSWGNKEESKEAREKYIEVHREMLDEGYQVVDKNGQYPTLENGDPNPDYIDTRKHYTDEQKDRYLKNLASQIDIDHYVYETKQKWNLEYGDAAQKEFAYQYFTDKAFRYKQISAEALQFATSSRKFQSDLKNGGWWNVGETRKNAKWNRSWEKDVYYGLVATDMVSGFSFTGDFYDVNTTGTNYDNPEIGDLYEDTWADSAWYGNHNVEYGFIKGDVLDNNFEDGNANSPFAVSEWSAGFNAILVIHKETKQAIRIAVTSLTLEQQRNIITDWMNNILNAGVKNMFDKQGNINPEWAVKQDEKEILKKAALNHNSISSVKVVQVSDFVQQAEIGQRMGKTYTTSYYRQVDRQKENLYYQALDPFWSDDVQESREGILTGKRTRKDLTLEEALELIPTLERIARKAILQAEGANEADLLAGLYGSAKFDVETMNDVEGGGFKVSGFNKKQGDSDASMLEWIYYNYLLEAEDLGFFLTPEQFNGMIGQGKGDGGILDSVRKQLSTEAGIYTQEAIDKISTFEYSRVEAQYVLNYEGVEGIEFEKYVNTAVDNHFTQLSTNNKQRHRLINGYYENGEEVYGVFDYEADVRDANFRIKQLQDGVGEEYENLIKGLATQGEINNVVDAKIEYYNSLINETEVEIERLETEINYLGDDRFYEDGDVRVYSDSELDEGSNLDALNLQKTGYQRSFAESTSIMNTYIQENPEMSDKEAATKYYYYQVFNRRNWENEASKTMITINGATRANFDDYFGRGSGTFQKGFENRLWYMVVGKYGSGGSQRATFSVKELLDNNIDVRNFTAWYDFDDFYISDSDELIFDNFEQERNLLKGREDHAYDIAFLELSPLRLDRDDAWLFGDSVYRTFAIDWFNYSSDEVMTTSTKLDAIQSVGYDMNRYYQENNQRVLDKIDIDPEAAIDPDNLIMPAFEWSKEAEENFKRTMWENVWEGAGAFVPMLVELAAITFATNGTMSYLGVASMLSRLRAGTQAYKAATKVKGVKRVLQGTRMVDGVKVTRAQNIWNHTKIALTELSLEEFKMQIAGFQTGSGASFYLGGRFTQWARLPIYKTTSKTRFKGMANVYNASTDIALNPLWMKLFRPGLVGAGSMELASVVETYIHNMGGLTGTTYEKEMQRLFGNMDEVEERFVTNALMFGIMGQAPSLHGKGWLGTQFKGKDFKKTIYKLKHYKGANYQNKKSIAKINAKIKEIYENAEGGGSKSEYHNDLISNYQKEIKEKETEIRDLGGAPKSKKQVSRKGKRAKFKRKKLKEQRRRNELRISLKNRRKVKELQNQVKGIKDRLEAVRKYLKLSDRQRADVETYREVQHDMEKLFKVSVINNKLNPSQNIKINKDGTLDTSQLDKHTKKLVFDMFNQVMAERHAKNQIENKELGDYVDLTFEFVQDGNVNLKMPNGKYGKAVYEPGKHKVYFNIKKFNSGVMSHEVFIHAALEGIRKANPELMYEFNRDMFTIFENAVGKEVSWNKDLRDLIKKEYGSLKEFKDIKQEEYLAFIVEIMTRKEFYEMEVAPTLFKQMKQEMISFVEETTGWSPLSSGKMTAQNFVNLVGRIGEGFRAGRTSKARIKQVTDLKNIDFLGIEFAANHTNRQKEKTASFDITTELQSLIRENKLLASKINVGNNREIITNNSNRIKEIKQEFQTEGISKENIERAIRNERNSKAVKEGMEFVEKDVTYQKLLKENKELKTTESLKALNDHVALLKATHGVTKPEAELIKDNMGIIDRMLKKNQDLSIEAEWYSETMKHVTDLIRTYDPAKNNAFGAYLTDMLNGGPQSPSPIGRYGNIVDALVKQGIIYKEGQSLKTVSYNAMEGGEGSLKTSFNFNTGKSTEISRVEWMKKGKKLTEEFNIDTKHIKSIEKQMNTIDLNTINYRDLVDLSPKWTEKVFGETVYHTEGKKKGKINQAATIQRKAEFIVENWKAIYEALPEGVMMQTGIPKLEGRSTQIQDLLLNGRLYETSGRTKMAKTGEKAGLDVQAKIEGLTKEQFLERLGIDIVDGNVITSRLKTQVRKPEHVNSNVLKDLQVEIGRVLTNQIVRNKMPEYLNEAKNRELAIDITQEQILNNLISGKSKKMASLEIEGFWDLMKEKGLIKDKQQGMWNAVLYTASLNNPKYIKEMDKGMYEEIRDFVQSETIRIMEVGRENPQYMVQLNALSKKLDLILPMSKISWNRTSKSLTPEAIKWFETKSLEIAEVMPPVLLEGKLGMVLEMFGLHYNTGLGKQARSHKKLEGDFKRQIIKKLKEQSDFKLSKETLQKYKDINWDLVYSAYSSMYKTGYRELMLESNFNKKWNIMQETFSVEAGKELNKLYDAHNSMLQEWLHNPKDMKNFNDKLDYIATMKKNNSNLGVTFERSWSPIGWVYIPKGSFPMMELKTSGEINKIKDPIKKQKAIDRNTEIIKSRKEHPFYKEQFEYFKSLKNKKGELKYSEAMAEFHALNEFNSKYEHLKASQNQSFESLNHIVNKTWKTDGMVGLGEYKGVLGILSRFNIIDRATGQVNASGIHRWAQNLEMAKDIYQIRTDGKKVTLYDHIVENALKIGGKEKAKLDILLDQPKVFANNKNKLKKSSLDLGEFEPRNNKELIKKSKEVDRLMDAIKNPKKKKGISVWDFDDTLAYSKSGVRYKMPNPSGKPAPRRKVIFMAGGAGSGKSNVIKQLGLEKQGFKIVNQDISLEWLMKNHGLPKDMKEFTPEQRSTWGKLTWEARKIALRKQMKFQGKGDGVVVDGTGANAKTMEKLVTEFKDKGYDVSMVLVNTSLATSQARNKARKERSLKSSIVTDTWNKVQANREMYKEMFGELYTEVFTDKLKQGDALPKEISNKINEFTSGYIKERLNAGEFADKGGKLLEKGAEFDFSEFNQVVEGKQGPFWKKAVDRVNKFGNEHNYILTARPVEAQRAIYQFMKSQGLEFKIENITGLANSTGEAKANWMIEKAKEGYNDFYFADDAIKNVEAVTKALNLLDVKSVVQQVKRKASFDMDKEFNQILEGSLGVKWQKEFSDVQAEMRGRKKGKWNYIMAPSAQDFKGLLYSFLEKGKKGEAQMKWFEEKLIKPFARGINDLNNHKQNMRNDHLALNKAFKDIKSEISYGEMVVTKKGVETNFTIEQAIRVHRWTEAGYEIPGLSKKDAKMLNDYVNSQSDLLGYSKSLGELTKLERGYSSPSEYWLAEGILTDLSNISEKVARKNYLKEFIENKNVIFSKKNLNKIESQLGPKFREALQDAVWAMETGQTRKEGSNRLVNKYMNWVNNSVGVIMFANMRSAALQTISSFNYINWKENNPFMAAKAFANLPQFGKDFAKIFNSNMLKQRRAGLKHGVNEAELAQALVGSKGSPKAVLHWLLKKGFLPTQIADSFAISMGGASYYRNRINMYLKQGLSQKKAEKKAWLDFQETTEVSQQSSRADLISQQQRSPLGRLILAFGNTPMQYARIMNKAARDLANNRGDAKHNISKIVYYGVLQSAMFTALQSFMTGFSLDEEDEDYDKSVGLLNGMVNNTLRGFGLGGVTVSTLKDTALQFHKQQKKKQPDHAYTILQALNFSPPIGSKARKIYSATQTWKYDEELIREMGLDIDNPGNLAVANVISATTNIPLDRLMMKIDNIREALDGRNSMIQRIASGMGWSKWVTGVQNEELIAFEEDFKEEQKIKKKEIKDQEKIDKKIIELREQYPDLTDREIKKEIEIQDKSKNLFDLNKREQEKLLNALDVDPNEFKKEADRVNKIIELYQTDSARVDSTIQAQENYTPTESEIREEELFKTTKKDQVNLLIDLGLSKRQINKLKYEKDRVDMIIKLQNKKKKRELVLQE